MGIVLLNCLIFHIIIIITSKYFVRSLSSEGQVTSPKGLKSK